jgi:flagellar biosynthesis/type III secretory pathway protein FliH
LEPATKQKSSPEPEFEFTSFRETKPAHFQVASSFWETLRSDPLLKAEFEKQVEDRANEILRDEAHPKYRALYEGFRKEGLEAGIAEGKSQVTELFQNLEKISSELVREKEKILRDHEPVWCEALKHVLQRFLVPLSPERLQGLHDWLQAAVGEVSQIAKVRVALSPAVYKAVAPQLASEHWEWVEDESLSGTELRAEVIGGGVFFSAEKEWEKLDAKLTEIFGVKSP